MKILDERENDDYVQRSKRQSYEKYSYLTFHLDPVAQNFKEDFHLHSPLSWAIYCGQHDLVKLLMMTHSLQDDKPLVDFNNNAGTDKQYLRTALAKAISVGKKEIVKALLDELVLTEGEIKQYLALILSYRNSGILRVLISYARKNRIAVSSAFIDTLFTKEGKYYQNRMIVPSDMTKERFNYQQTLALYDALKLFIADYDCSEITKGIYIKLALYFDDIAKAKKYWAKVVMLRIVIGQGSLIYCHC